MAYRISSEFEKLDDWLKSTYISQLSIKVKHGKATNMGSEMAYSIIPVKAK